MKDNVLILKNSKHINLEWSFLVLEYLEEYPGGIRELRKDIKLKRNEIKVNNMLCYAVVKANIDEVLTYNEIIKLLDLKAIRKILEFVKSNEEELSEFKKKDQIYLKKNTKKNLTKKKR